MMRFLTPALGSRALGNPPLLAQTLVRFLIGAYSGGNRCHYESPGGGLSLDREFPRFAGSWKHSLDQKGRLVVPSRVRERLGSIFVLTAPPFVPCLVLYPLVTWRAIGEQLAREPLKDDEYWEVVRDWTRHADDEVACDVQGRLSIPTTYRNKAGLERDVEIVGAQTRVELWDPQRLEAARPDADTAKRVAARLSLL
ncbi:MAG: hypothetical protein JO043_06505 [Candidatus Eremiobacteraeota bacterium]|nr:hypothetical protein [Candidatus Eremiobacteraeota bacterium]